ncbi:alpha/beta hydrolase fold-domain-containing protein [Cubamyces menziesii]|nr:alpha/beta hydrolase fold-domain-containing protein [Cubamyces menziesii]
MSLHAHLAAPDPKLGPLLAQLGPPAPPTDDSLVLRRQFEAASFLHQAEWEDRLPPASEYLVAEHAVRVDAEGEDGHITVRSYTPTSRDNQPEGGFPLLVWYHGGGFVAGDLDLDDNYLRNLCVDLQQSIVNVGYRLAPEHVFPAGFNDAYAGLKWAARHAPALRASLKAGFIAGGTSAGANLAAAVALRARDDPFFAPGSGREITGQLLQTPQVVHPAADVGRYAPELRSMEEQAGAPFLTARKLRAFADALRAPPNDERISPLLATSHEGLPRAFIQVFGMDPLRDEGLLYARLLRDAGVQTRLNIYPGVPHTFMMVFPETEVAARVERDVRDGLRWLLAPHRPPRDSGCLML